MNYDMVEFIKSFCSLVTLYLSSLLITIENYYFFAERTYNLQRYNTCHTKMLKQHFVPRNVALKKKIWSTLS
jgi:hypothetical protein